MAVGVARPMAQGQAMTSTLVNTLSTKDTSCPAISQTMAASTAIAITMGTKTPATLSAILEMGAFLPWASSTILIIFESVVSAPTRVMRT